MRAQREFKLPTVQRHILGSPRAGWTMLLSGANVSVVVAGMLQPSAHCGLLLTVSYWERGQGKTVCPFHLSSFLMPSESAWCLGTNFLVFFFFFFFSSL